MKKLIFSLIMLGFFFPSLLLAEQDEARYQIGKQTYRRCVACHTIKEKRNKMGPHLMGIWERQIASAKGFPYSKAFKKLDFKWNADMLSNYLKNPRAFIPKNRMAFAGIKDKKRRDALIYFLKIETAKQKK